jgi:hypothetical protein
MNKQFRAFLLVFTLLALSRTTQAQLEVTHLILKGQSATGFGAFIHGGFPVSKGDEIGVEANFDFFAPDSSHLVFIPLLVTYRYTFNRTGTGFYVEPVAGYTFGTTDVQAKDGNGNLLYNADGSEVDEKFNGAAAGLGVGYIIPDAHYPLNFCLRYEHVFVSGAAPSLLSFRVSWSVLTGRRLQGQQ